MHQRVPRLTVGGVLAEKQIGLDCIDASCRLPDALRGLADKALESILVLDSGRMVGIFSLRNFAHAVATAGMPAMTLSVADVMTPCHWVVSPEDSAQTCLHLMLENNLHFIPVQQNEQLIALLSRDDLQRGIIANYEKVFRESALDQQILFLRGTYSC